MFPPAGPVLSSPPVCPVFWEGDTDMGVLNLFRKKARPERKAAQSEPEPEIYSGMRVEVTNFDGRLLFGAKLANLQGTRAELYQYTEALLPTEEEPVRVRIRGFSDYERKAVYMEGTISPKPKHVWKVEELQIVRAGNDRAFFRLDTNLDATLTLFGGFGAGERECKLLNISVGGACVGIDHELHLHDKFLLKVRLLEDRETSVMYCEVLRVIDKGDSKFEYGCRFLELAEADQDRITQNIFDAQRKKRARF